MRYHYGTNDSYTNGYGTEIGVRKLASIIKNDVEMGKWNIYEGGRANSITAKCRYKKNGFEYHNYLLIYGTETEIRRLEEIIKNFIKVIPRIY